MRKIGLVVQRFGTEVTGGSEHLCRLVAQRLANRFEVEVITTCALDYLTWQDHYKPGMGEDGGIPVRRFRVDRPRQVESFAALCGETFAGVSRGREVDWMRQQGPYSTGLLQHLERHGSDYNLILFFTYLYCTTWYGLPLVRERALLIPTAHDEPPIYLGIFDELFAQVRYSLFLTPEEEEFAARRFHLPNDAGQLLPVAIDPPNTATVAELPEALRGVSYLLYVGRVDISKGCQEMIEFFIRYRDESRQENLRLAVVGKEAIPPMPRHPSVLMLGFQEEDAKLKMLEHAQALIAPSPYESLCIAAIEAWHAGIPVIANGRCEVLRGQCIRTQGGLSYRDYDEFRAACDAILQPGARDTFGQSGKRYVAEHYSSARVEEQYARIVERFAC